MIEGLKRFGLHEKGASESGLYEEFPSNLLLLVAIKRKEEKKGECLVLKRLQQSFYTVSNRRDTKWGSGVFDVCFAEVSPGVWTILRETQVDTYY